MNKTLNLGIVAHVDAGKTTVSEHFLYHGGVERSVQILDGAILVISAKEGAQAQTRVLYDTLKRLQIPTIIFINKLDRMSDSIEQLYKEINNQLDMKSVFMQKIENYGDNIILTPWEYCAKLVEKNLEQVIDLDTSLLDSYLKGEKESHSKIRTLILRKINTSEISPIFHGVALKGIGIVSC